VIAYRATLDVPRELVWFVAKLLLAERRRRGTPRGSRALSCFWQAVMGLRWFRDRTTADALARDHGVSRATAYPGSVHDITAARIHALPGLYQAATADLPTLADPGYDGAGLGILIPVKQPPGGELDINTRTRNAIQRSLRCLGERGFALLTGRWRTLQHITASPSKIGDIARAALVLTHFEYGYIT
jgi:DDE superfamily endonuclease